MSGSWMLGAALAGCSETPATDPDDTGTPEVPGEPARETKVSNGLLWVGAPTTCRGRTSERDPLVTG